MRDQDRCIVRNERPLFYCFFLARLSARKIICPIVEPWLVGRRKNAQPLNRRFSVDQHFNPRKLRGQDIDKISFLLKAEIVISRGNDNSLVRLRSKPRESAKNVGG